MPQGFRSSLGFGTCEICDIITTWAALAVQVYRKDDDMIIINDTHLSVNRVSGTTPQKALDRALLL